MAVRGPTTFQAATIALGQPNLDSGQPNQGTAASAASLHEPAGMALTPEGGLLVADSANHRILLFSQGARMSGQEADAVVGQASPSESDPSVSRDGLNGPRALAVGQGKLVVADREAHRVLIYDDIPRPGSMLVPVAVLGQGGFELSENECGPTNLSAPSAVAITPTGQLLVVDSGNHRVLLWETIPGEGDPITPSRVLGQPDLASCAPNDGNEDGVEDLDEDGVTTRPAAHTFSNPQDLWTDGTRLVVVDGGNNRVLVWNDFPLVQGRLFVPPPDLVLGHDTFTNPLPNVGRAGDPAAPTAHTLDTPSGVHSDGSSLVVADRRNDRVLVWNRFPEASFQPADVVLGHADMETGHHDGTASPTSRHLSGPFRVLLTPDALLVSDRGHHRVVVYPR